MYRLSPDDVNATLPEGPQVNANGLQIALLEGVSEAKREKMTAIN